MRAQVASLDKQVRARTAVALAQGILVGRYRLAHADDAFALMRDASQKANIKLHQIAAALAAAPAPAPGAPVWFTARTHTAPPSLAGMYAGDTLDPRNQQQVLTAALTRVRDITGAEAGNVQLAEAGLLRLERHHEHPRAFTEYFAFVEDGTACSRAARAGRQVTVRDIATADVFDETTRQVILDSGSRACHSVPLTGSDGVARGVISAHLSRPTTGFGQTRLAALQQAQRTVGAWLQWYRDTVLLDVLETLHHRAMTTQAHP
ncbi:ANTAR domain-containing protein [Streptomyces sp. NPDC006552]|uniref:ANTAR domain-containing protein n=1 Tax=Streptomyces sp. NPDC006552 TaxID=3157179 RepID=UPI0033A96B71